MKVNEKMPLSLGHRLRRQDIFMQSNRGKELNVGCRVEDTAGSIGIVTEIIPHDPDNLPAAHGFVTVALEEIRRGTPVGLDGEEHYTEVNWNSFLKILDDE